MDEKQERESEYKTRKIEELTSDNNAGYRNYGKFASECLAGKETGLQLIDGYIAKWKEAETEIEQLKHDKAVLERAFEIAATAARWESNCKGLIANYEQFVLAEQHFREDNFTKFCREQAENELAEEKKNGNKLL